MLPPSSWTPATPHTPLVELTGLVATPLFDRCCEIDIKGEVSQCASKRRAPLVERMFCLFIRGLAQLSELLQFKLSGLRSTEGITNQVAGSNPVVTNIERDTLRSQLS